MNKQSSQNLVHFTSLQYLVRLSDVRCIS